jgi:hypothetical protein
MYELRESPSIFVKHRNKVFHDIVSLECILGRVSIEVVPEILYKYFSQAVCMVDVVLETKMCIELVKI